MYTCIHMRHHRTRPWHMLVFLALFVSPAAHGATRHHAWEYSGPEEGTPEHCMAKRGSQINDESNGTITQGCEDWGETVKDTYRALGVLQDESKMSGTFGSKDALASIMAGAISAARMNITEYVTEGETNIQNWRGEIEQLKSQLIANRSISDSGLIAGAVLCCVSAYVCVPSILVSQLVQLGFEFPTYKITKEIDFLMREPHKYITPYFTEKGQQVNALLEFFRVINDLNETKQGGLIFLGNMLTSYVSMAIVSNATKTAADVLNDLDTMSRVDMNANVKILAGMMFNDTQYYPYSDPPEITSYMTFSTVVRGLFTISILGNVVKKAVRFYNDFVSEGKEYVEDLGKLADANRRLTNIFGADSNFLKEAREELSVREGLIKRIEDNGLLTEEELVALRAPPQSNPIRIEKVPYPNPNPAHVINTVEETGSFETGSVQESSVQESSVQESVSVLNKPLYRLRRGAAGVGQLKRAILNTARYGTFWRTQNSVTLLELQETVDLAQKRIKLVRITATKPRLFTGYRLWKFTPVATLILSVVTAAFDAANTAMQFYEIDYYVSSTASAANLEMKDTKDVLQLWQDYHTSLRDLGDNS